MAVYNGINGKFTVSGNVIGGCKDGNISVERNVAEFSSVGSETMELAGGVRSVSWSINSAWAGSRYEPIIKGTGSNWNIILEVTGGAVMIASGCLANAGEWSMEAGEITTETLSGRAIDFFASGISLN